jgi:trans-aconitate methyltransferase
MWITFGSKSMDEQIQNLDEFLLFYQGDKALIEERFITKATLKLVSDYCHGKAVLNLGLGNGLIAEYVTDIAKKQVIVEGSPEIIEKFSDRVPSSEVVLKYFEDIQDVEKYDVVLANHVLEHVADPRSILRDNIMPALVPGGKLIATVPNALSLHRRIGKSMGLLKHCNDLNANDIRGGHQRVYYPEQFKEDIELAGFRIDVFSGYNLKLVSLEQMKHWSDDLLEAIYDVSLSLPPEMCSNLMAVGIK